MLRIGICDDEPIARDTLAFQLEQLVHRKENDLLIQEFSNAEELLAYINCHGGQMDILFLDIEMPGADGIAAARKIRRLDDTLLLIFVTSHRDYVFQGYEVNALDYLIKPLNKEKLKGVMKRCLTALQKNSHNFYSIKTKEGMFRIPRVQILYCFSQGRKVTLITDSREYSFYEKLDVVQQQLGQGFVRIHQRYLVQAAKVHAVEGDTVAIGDKFLPISRACRQQALLEFVRAML